MQPTLDNSDKNHVVVCIICSTSDIYSRMGQVICPFMWYITILDCDQLGRLPRLAEVATSYTDHKRLIIPTDHYQKVTGEHLIPPLSHYGSSQIFTIPYLCSCIQIICCFWYICGWVAGVQWTQLHGQTALDYCCCDSLSSSKANTTTLITPTTPVNTGDGPPAQMLVAHLSAELMPVCNTLSHIPCV